MSRIRVPLPWFLAAFLLLPPAAPAATRLFVNGTIHTVSGPVLPQAAVRVENGLVSAVLPAPTADPTADEVVDLRGAHLYPGLIALDTVLGLMEIEGVRATRDAIEVGDFRPDVFAWVAVRPDSDLIPVARANGFTHAQTTPRGGVASGFSGVLVLDGWTHEEMALRKVAALHLDWPEFGLDPTPKEKTADAGRWRSMDDQIKERRARLQAIDDFFRDAEAYAAARRAALGEAPPYPAPGQNGARPPVSPKFPVVPAWEAMLPVVDGTVPVFVHAQDPRQIRSAVEWAVGRKLRVALVGPRDAAKVTDLLARHRVPVVFEDVFTLPLRDTDPYDVHFATPALLARAGVRVAFGAGSTRDGASNIRNLPYAAAQAVAFGLSPDEALRGLTLYPAEILGVADRLGSIAPGKEASLFMADGDILDIRTRVLRLWIAGKEVPLDSRHTRLNDRYRARPAPR